MNILYCLRGWGSSMRKFRDSKLFYILLFLLFCVVTFCYSMFLSNSISDEIWSFSFSYNIASGLIPYRDFNMIVTPLFSILGSFFVNIFGNYIFSVHIFAAIWVGVIMVLLYKVLGWKSLICYIYLMLYHIPSYNFLSLFWIFCILYLIEIKKDSDIIIGILVSLAFLTKQSIGIFLLIPFIFYSKNRIKGLVSFLIPILLCCIYLIYKSAFWQFIDYCFLGMFEFGGKNSCYDFLIPEIVILVYLIYKLVKSKFRDKQCFYILMFQVMVFPIIDATHFFIAFPTVVYYLINRDIKTRKDLHCLLYISVFGVAYLLFSINYEFNIVKDDNFMYLRNADLKLMELDAQMEVINNYDDYDYKFYILDTACFFKLYRNEHINKFDILNNGNFGYRGSRGYMKDIDNICKNNSCVFFVAYWYYDEVKGQLNKDIIDYVVNDYNLIDRYKYFDVYSNS